MPEYGCWPIWTSDPTEDFDYNIDPHTLGLSEALAAALDAWALEFDATLNQDYPPDSDFPSPEARAAFLARGENLFAQLQQELPSATWTFRRELI
jgi:hypothetical protein